jgi:ubiquinone/menaquinone biosynthesis C-methylase UbiE
MTRWQQFYQQDPGLARIAPSQFSQKAAGIFWQYGKHRILDLACGMARDSLVLSGHGLAVTSGDLSFAGLTLAHRTLSQTPHPPHLAQLDARRLPLPEQSFDGVYCFGLLHEFPQADGWEQITQVMAEIQRVLAPGGILMLAVLAGDPRQGLPHVLLFDEAMFDQALQDFACLEKTQCSDRGCTGREDYNTWQGVFVNPLQPAM